QAAPLDQAQDGVADVEVARPAVEVVGGQEDLRDVRAVGGERLLVGAHEHALADGGAGLELPQSAGPFAQAEFADAGPDCPGGDEDDFAAGRPQPLHLVGERADAVAVEGAAGVGQDVGPDLDDDRVGQGNDFL